MKRRIIYILSIMTATLFLAGCGAKADTSSEVRPKEAAASKTETSAQEEVSSGKTDTEADTNTEVEKTAATAGTETGKTDKETASDTGENISAGNSLLTEEDVKKIALEDAGVEEQNVTGIRIKLDRDDRKQEYEVEFYADNKEYDYEIDAVTGEIRGKDMDIENDFYSKGSSETVISETEAKSIALEMVPGATEDDMRMHLDYDDGRTIYEGSIIYNRTEYDFEIDAESGVILEWEEEH